MPIEMGEVLLGQGEIDCAYQIDSFTKKPFKWLSSPVQGHSNKQLQYH